MTKKIKTRHRKFTDAERKANHSKGQRLDRKIELFIDPEGKFRL